MVSLNIYDRKVNAQSNSLHKGNSSQYQNSDKKLYTVRSNENLVASYTRKEPEKAFTVYDETLKINSQRNIGTLELDSMSELNSSVDVSSHSKRRPSHRASHRQFHSGVSQFFKNISSHSHKLGKQLQISEKKVILAMYLEAIFTRRKRYSLQLIKYCADGQQ